MSKIDDMAMTIEELRSAAEAINNAVDRLCQQFSESAAISINDTSSPEKVPALEEVRAVLADVSRAGHTAEVRSLLQKYGASRLSEVDRANYKALLADAEVLSDATLSACNPACP